VQRMTKGSPSRSARTAPVPERPSRRSTAHSSFNWCAWREDRIASTARRNSVRSSPLPRWPTVPSHWEEWAWRTVRRVRTTSPRVRPVEPGAQTSSRRRCAAGRSSLVGKARWRAASRVPSMSKTFHRVPARSVSPQGCCSHAARRESRSSRNSVRKASTGSSVKAAQKRESVERAGKRSRPNRAMNATAHG